MRRTPYRASSAFGAILQYRFPIASTGIVTPPLGPLEVISWEVVNISGETFIRGSVNRPAYIGMDYGLIRGAANYTNSTFMYIPGATRLGIPGPILALGTDFLLSIPDPLFGLGSGGSSQREFNSSLFNFPMFNQRNVASGAIYFGTIFGSLSAEDPGVYIDIERAFQLT